MPTMKQSNIITDMHLHSNYSTDAKDSMEAVINGAYEKGLKIIALTDHIDIDYPEIGYEFVFDLPKYKDDILYLREKYKDKIEVLSGLEIGLQPHIVGEIDKIVDFLKPDFIIGSTHCVFKEEISSKGLFKNRTMIESYDRYFEAVIENITCCDDFDSLGHIDFVERYYPADEKILDYKKHKTLIDKILGLVIKKEKAIEINTSGFRYRLGKTHPSIEIIGRYRELGGKLLTIGSDSHRVEDIAADFDKVQKILKQLNIDTYHYFKKRTPVALHI